jgi:hypothetical protein
LKFLLQAITLNREYLRLVYAIADVVNSIVATFMYIALFEVLADLCMCGSLYGFGIRGVAYSDGVSPCSSGMPFDALQMFSFGNIGAMYNWSWSEKWLNGYMCPITCDSQFIKWFDSNAQCWC